MVGALRWRREVFWFNLFSGDVGVAAPWDMLIASCAQRQKLSGRLCFPNSDQALGVSTGIHAAVSSGRMKGFAAS